ncbi:hypothetical protein AB4Z42_17090 [Mycobacterium sp. 2YAF39]|uniref:hypothetical protein n=1 Tax=Mycobacterium sp. 2YAF39 TaxID=3233033 RepID=UPI003F9A304A
MALDWFLLGTTHSIVEKGDTQDHHIDGTGAYANPGSSEDCYEIWPVDPKGTGADGWRLSLDTEADPNKEIGIFRTIDEAKQAAQDHVERS